MADQFYILSEKWTEHHHTALWYRPERKGYTKDLKQAGRYDDAEVNAHLSYYNNGHATRAVPCHVAESLGGGLGTITIPADAQTMAALRAAAIPLPEASDLPTEAHHD